RIRPPAGPRRAPLQLPASCPRPPQGGRPSGATRTPSRSELAERHLPAARADARPACVYAPGRSITIIGTAVRCRSRWRTRIMLPNPMTRLAVGIVVVAEFLGTSLWFSANAAADDLRRSWGLGAADLGALTGAVQLGFITGTLVFALSGLADRYPASRIFAACAVAGAAANAGFALAATGVADGCAWRFMTGVALAGVYPVGMKLVVGWAPERAGEALGWLVGMLTLGTALPHAVRAAGAGWTWSGVVLASSALALVAAFLVARLGDGPHLKPVAGTPARWGGVIRSFAIPAFRSSALGYFG